MPREGTTMTFSANRDHWPYPGLIPQQIIYYPMPQFLPEVDPQPAGRWPRPPKPDLLEWKDKTKHLKSSGNQLYIHVPFCPFFCDFCPLYKVQDSKQRTKDRKEQYVQHLLREIEMYASIPAATQPTFHALYFGGGTPTELTPEQIGRILDAIRASFQLADNCEITLEGVARQMLVPGYLEACVERGINRISFGVQALDKKVRRAIGRGERIDAYGEVLELVRTFHADFPTNIDVMIGLPEQDEESVRSDFEQFVKWNPGGVDVYSYMMMPDTDLYRDVMSEKKASPGYGKDLLQFRDITTDIMKSAGYEQITGEVFVRDHNVFMRTSMGGGGNGLNSVLALGPSAIGHLNGTSYRNVADLDAYEKAIDNNLLPISNASQLNARTAKRRAVLYGLQRLYIDGMLSEGFERQFRAWTRAGLIERARGGYQLTELGALWYNQMQFDITPIWEKARLLPLLGSLKDQEDLLKRSNRDPVAREIKALARGHEGILGDLQMAVYRGVLKAGKLRIIDERAVGWIGDGANHRLLENER